MVQSVQYILINVRSCGHFGYFKGVGSGGDVQGVVGGVALGTKLEASWRSEKGTKIENL